MANPEIAAYLSGVNTSGVAEDRGGGRDDHILHVAEDRDERIRKSQRKRSAVFHIAQKDEG